MTLRLLGCSVVAACLLLLVPETARAWWKTGHHVVADIAFDRLEKGTRDKIVAILRCHPRLEKDFVIPMTVRALGKDAEDRWLFLIAGEWPDIIRGTPAYDRQKWHYINNPFFLGAIDREVLSKSLKINAGRELPSGLKDAHDPDDLNGSQAVKLCLKRLAQDIGAERKAVYICWLSHLVGDLHQPCHTSSLYSRGLFHGNDGDRGGNGIPTVQSGNLHAFWDSLLGGTALASAGDVNAVRKRSLAILAVAEHRLAAEKAGTKPNIDLVISESFDLVRSVTYDKVILDEVRKQEVAGGKLRPIDLPVEYRRAAGELARRRVAEAGYRLAALLEKAVK